MDNVLDLTDQSLSEDGFLINLRKAFDAGETILEVKINSETAMGLHGSPALNVTPEGTFEYCSLFGIVEVTPVSNRQLNQTQIDTHNVDSIQ